jgi:DNA-binding response OmpR family regulator
MRVLIVEDEERMADLVRQGLEEEGFGVDVTHNGIEAFDWITAFAYDVIVLDIMLPGMNGIDICSTLRAQGAETPILLLTARYRVANRVEGLNSGADDYLVKPFAIEELVARVRALTRRRLGNRSADLVIGDLVLNTITKRARRRDRVIELSAKEYAVLETLMRHPDQVLSREQIIQHVWNADYDSPSKLVEVYIHALRRKIDEEATLKLIQTVRGFGYRISSSENP